MAPITDGTVQFIVTKSGGVLPGTVTAFSGTFKDGYPVDKNTGMVDKEWHLCDGTNGTPDLRSRFIYGGDGTNNGATGGEASHPLTIAELPKESPYGILSVTEDGGLIEAAAVYGGAYHGRLIVTKVGSCTALYGGNQPHNNMPPYYTLAYIMKL